MKKRSLTPVESREARLVFATSLDLSEVRILENADWPRWVGRIAAALNHRAAPPSNAVTLGTKIYFSRALAIPLEQQPGGFQDMAWLLHELTHVWQYRRTGWTYLLRALWAYFRHGHRVYDYGGAEGLNRAHREAKGLADFNPEQQGDIVRDYYVRLKAHADLDPWDRFLPPVRSTSSR